MGGSLCPVLHITKRHVVSNAILDTLPQGQQSELAWPQETTQCIGVTLRRVVKVKNRLIPSFLIHCPLPLLVLSSPLMIYSFLFYSYL